MAQAQIDTALPAIDSNNLVAAMDALQIVQNRVSAMRSLCDSLVFEGTANQVLGPLTFPTEGFFIAGLTVLQGECGSGTYMTPSIFNVGGGEATTGSEAVFQSNECVALIEVSNIQQPWKLEFERLTV